MTLAFDIYAVNPDPIHSTAGGDGSARTMRLVRRVSRTFMLRPGQGATLEIEAARAGEAVGAWVLGSPPEPIQDSSAATNDGDLNRPTPFAPP